jgi:hypothetical protein
MDEVVIGQIRGATCLSERAALTGIHSYQALTNFMSGLEQLYTFGAFFIKNYYYYK